MNRFFYFLLFVIILTSCNTEDSVQQKDNTNVDTKEDLNSVYSPSKEAQLLDEYVLQIDTNKTWRRGESLFYTKDDGHSNQVAVVIDDSNYIVKIEEEYTLPNSPCVLRNVFYFKNAKMVVSKEYFEKGDRFVEQVVYYNNEKPFDAKRRDAPYEEELEYVDFYKTTPKKVSYQKAIRLLNAKEEFETNFQEFIEDEGTLYMIVGENKPNGYYSSIVLQSIPPIIAKLRKDPKGMKGFPLSVTTEKVKVPQGYEYQVLVSVSERK